VSDPLAESATVQPGYALFTIGYERRTQSEYLELLVGAGVTLLGDVRRNPVSRKKGFSKGTLAQGCAAVGIRYEHLSELGIASEKRKNLATREAVDALFAEYERHWLPQQGAALAKLRAWLEAGERVALTCFERAPGDCHRHCVADALVREATALEAPRVDVTHL
jgi:uncharacterized protein (DUF488 family)